MYNLTFLYNSFVSYPISSIIFNYILLEFLPATVTANYPFHKIQGYRAGNIDFTFVNCDGNPSSYLAFYFNVNNYSMLAEGNSNPFSNGWLTTATNLSPSDCMPERFYFAYEMHMGGCGALSTTRDMGGIKGAVGLPFGKSFKNMTNMIA